MEKLIDRLRGAHGGPDGIAMCQEERRIVDIIDRLAAYEGTGLEPKGIVYQHEVLCQYLALGSIDHLRELVQAENDGRPVVPGARVYVLLQDGTDYYPKTNGWYISEEEIGAVSQSGFYVGEPTDGVHFSYEQIGKTVFMTYEEAEKALEDGR